MSAVCLKEGQCSVTKETHCRPQAKGRRQRTTQVRAGNAKGSPKKAATTRLRSPLTRQKVQYTVSAPVGRRSTVVVVMSSATHTAKRKRAGQTPHKHKECSGGQAHKPSTKARTGVRWATQSAAAVLAARKRRCLPTSGAQQGVPGGSGCTPGHSPSAPGGGKTKY